MKMEGVTELMNGSPAEATAQPVPIGIGREFIRQYYTLLAEKPEEVFRFYSHESTYNHNGVEALGQANIQKAIGSLHSEFVGSHARIHDIKGAFTANNAILLQVIGVLEVHGQEKRGFVQSVVLCQQTAKKFFVMNDIFQYVDQVVSHEAPAPTAPVIPMNTPKTTEKTKAVVNGTTPAQNGHTTPTNPSPVKPLKERKEPKEKESHPSVPQAQATPEATPKKAEKEEKRPPPTTPQTQVEPAKVAPQDNAPKSWAGMVRQGTNHNSQPKEATRPAPPTPQVIPRATQKENDFMPKTPNLYLGNITRSIVPDSTTTAENEIRGIFEKFGSVESVSVPKKVLDLPNDTSRPGFAFITMKSVADATAVFRHTTKDERGNYVISLKVDAFGFDGLASLSEQQAKRERDGPGGGRGGRFGGQSGGGGRGGSNSFPPRGASRGAFRGGRGSFQNVQ